MNMNVECTWCKEKNSEGVPVEPYMVEIEGKSEFLYGCYECIDENTVPIDRTPVLLPDGWMILGDKASKQFREHRQALMDVNREMEKAQGLPDSDKWYPHPAGRLGELLNNLNSRIKSLNLRFKQLGILHASANDFGDNQLMPSGRHCPDCGGPLVSVRSVKDKHALTDPVFRQDHYRHSQACLGCLLVFTGRKIS